MNRCLSLIRSAAAANLRYRNYSTLPPEVVIHLDKQTIVCWHPEQPFPYECSKPVSLKESNEVLKDNKIEVREMFRKMRPEENANVLAKLTQTTKHRWFPRARDKREKKRLTDRKFL